MDGTILNKKYKLEERVSALEEGGGYTLPVASDDTLGGVKVGDGLSINENGVLSNSQTPYTPPNYSTSEVDTGVKWIDGKNIFRKVVDCGALPNNTSKVVSSGLTNIFVISAFGFAKTATGDYSVPIPSPTTNNKNLQLNINQSTGDMTLYSADDYSSYTNSFVILEYTKTPAASKSKK